MRVYQKIKKYLEENGIKQKFLSDKTGIPENTLSMMLSGSRKIDADELVKIVISLNLDANYFIKDVSNEEKN